jgi:isoamylase
VAPESVFPDCHEADVPLLRADGTLPVAIWAPDAAGIALCLPHPDRPGDPTAERRVELAAVGDGWWRGAAAGVAAGALYGVRVHAGAGGPGSGLGDLLLDPYARAVTTAGPGGRPCCVVPDPATDAGPTGFDWSRDVRPAHARDGLVVDEIHVRGYTRLHPDVPEAQRGTYAGLAHPAVVAHLQALGATAVELLPVHQFATEPRLAALGLTNVWGYNTLAFNAPHDGYSSAGGRGGQVGEFKAMVAALHEAGIAVLLDVVYNHTAEQGPDGVTTSLRGLADRTSYRHTPDGAYLDVTGCGNTVDLSHPVMLRLVLDSLRYWVTQMHVDGFRFDLAPALCRAPVARGNGFDPVSPFLAAVGQDPVLRRAVLIAEPWDIGDGGYVLGGFPPGWAEWNDRFRDTVRDFWRGGAQGVAAPRPMPERRSARRVGAAARAAAADGVAAGGTPVHGAVAPGALAPGALAPGALAPGALAPGALAPGAVAAGTVAPVPPVAAAHPAGHRRPDHGATLRDLASRLAGSSDAFDHGGRSPLASVNFVTAHDGFTLTDLVSYDGKHNEANGEDNRDGTGDNRSSNHGVEGPSADADVLELRARQRRNLLATVLLSAGTPMLLGGDELDRTQDGNNNAYCLDDPTTWVDWSAAGAGPGTDLTRWVRRLIDLRTEHACLRPTVFAEQGEPGAARWLTGTGLPMEPGDWFDPDNQTLGMLRPGVGVDAPAVLALFHARAEHRTVRLPQRSVAGDAPWRVVADSAYPVSSRAEPDQPGVVEPGAAVGMTARSVVVLVQRS